MSTTVFLSSHLDPLVGWSQCHWASVGPLLDSPGFFSNFLQSQHLLDNSSCHISELKCFKPFKIEFESTTSMKVNSNDDLDALESSTHAQLQARELKSLH